MDALRAISITFLDARNQADNLDNCASDLKNVETQLTGVMEALQAGWSGDAASQYLAKCGTLQEKLGSTVTDLEQIARVIRKAAQAYYDAETRAIEIANTNSSGG